MNGTEPRPCAAASDIQPDAAPGALVHDQSEFNVIFVHSRLDDYGLNAAQFRAYCHLARRASSGAAWPSIESIARVCRLHPKTVRSALRVLTRHSLLTREERPGRTPLYKLTPPSQWHPPKHIDQHPSKTNTPVSDGKGTPLKPSQGYPSQMEPDEGNPSEGNPKKVIHSLAGARAERVRPVSSSQNSLEEESAAIFAAYPRRVGGRAARQAIKRALQKVPFEQLLKTTEQFAKAWADALPEEQRYCPHPAKWFAEERYDDDPATWGPAPAANQNAVSSTVSIPQQIRNLDELIAEAQSKYEQSLNPSEGLRNQLRTWKKTRLELRKRLAEASVSAVTDAGPKSS